MLGKLIKYELSATKKNMLMMYLVFITLSTLISIHVKFKWNASTFFINSAWGEQLYMITEYFVVASYIVLNFAVIMGVFFYAISRFKKNILGSEGYLMHTLPVSEGLHVLSKTIVSLIWSVISLAVLGVSYLILSLGLADTGYLRDVYNIIRSNDFVKAIDFSRFSEFLTILVIFGLCFFVSTYLRLYASMAMGYSFKRMRTLNSIVMYIVLIFVTSLFKVIPSVIISFIPAINPDAVNTKLVLESIHCLFECFVYYFIANYFLSKKLKLL